MDPLRELVLPRLDGVKKSGGVWSARCPAHEDRQASLSVSVGRDHPVVFHCHAGCPPDAIVSALSLAWGDLTASREEPVGTGEVLVGKAVVATYDYRDVDGRLLFQVVRLEGKDFRQRQPDGGGGWLYKVTNDRVLYRLPELIAAAADTIWVAEGEKDVAALVAAGVQATCCPGGAGKWDRVRADCNDVFTGAHVVIVRDRDEPGVRHAEQVRAVLEPIAAGVVILEAASGKDAADHLRAGHSLADFVQVWPVPLPEPASVLLTVFLAGDDPEYDWLVPGLLERSDRMILTGEEGKGKSTLLRQIAIQLASGIHPFTDERFDPVRVLYVDLENSERQLRRKFRELFDMAGVAYSEPPGLWVKCRPEGLNINEDDDSKWLFDEVKAVAPDLLITGPIYKLVGGDATEEGPAKKASRLMDLIRAEVGAAVLLEAHTPYGQQGGKRPERPYGASLWSRWPEFGVFLDPGGALRHWRGPRDERDWPALLERGGAQRWPWMPVDRPNDVRWAKIAEHCRIHGQVPQAVLADLVGVHQATISRLIRMHKAEWEALAQRA